jgi:hypothetical protein
VFQQNQGLPCWINGIQQEILIVMFHVMRFMLIMRIGLGTTLSRFMMDHFGEVSGMLKPHINILNMETILCNHLHSGHHSSVEEWLQGIKSSLLNTKGKGMDASYFCAFLMLEDEDFKFACHWLHYGIGAGAGTAGNGSSKEEAECLGSDSIGNTLWKRLQKIQKNVVLRLKTPTLGFFILHSVCCKIGHCCHY